MTDSCRQDRDWMLEAIAESRKGRFIAPPNPAVGCVIVRDGIEIARGYTHAPGSAHAEIDAINNAKKAGLSVEGATFYVTLEPCSHYGRTPPCALRLIQEKAARVVAALRDPNPLVAGKGLAMLEQAGIQGDCGVCRQEAYDANIGFLTRMQRSTPWVRMKTAASLDGRTALANGQSQWITGPQARRAGHLLRAQAQGILTGIGTVLADDPQMNVRLEGDYPNPVKYVVDRWAQTPLGARILQGRPCVIFAGKSADSAKIAALEQAGAEVRIVDETAAGLDLHAVIASIGADAVNELHVEAGAGLSGALLAAGLVDEIVCFCAPCLMGEGLPIARLPQCQTMDQVERWRFCDVCRVGEDLQLTLRKN